MSYTDEERNLLNEVTEIMKRTNEAKSTNKGLRDGIKEVKADNEPLSIRVQNKHDREVLAHNAPSQQSEMFKILDDAKITK